MKKIATIVSALCLATNTYAVGFVAPTTTINSARMEVKNNKLEYSVNYSANCSATITAYLYIKEKGIEEKSITLEEIAQEGQRISLTKTNNLDNSIIEFLHRGINNSGIEGKICAQPYGGHEESCSEQFKVETDIVPDSKNIKQKNLKITQKDAKDQPDPTKDIIPTEEEEGRVKIGARVHLQFGRDGYGAGYGGGGILGYDFNEWFGVEIAASSSLVIYHESKKSGEFNGAILSFNSSLYIKHLSLTPEISILTGKETIAWYNNPGGNIQNEKRDIQDLGIGGYIGYRNEGGHFRVGATYFFKNLTPEKKRGRGDKKTHYPVVISMNYILNF